MGKQVNILKIQGVEFDNSGVVGGALEYAIAELFVKLGYKVRYNFNHTRTGSGRPDIVVYYKPEDRRFKWIFEVKESACVLKDEDENYLHFEGSRRVIYVPIVPNEVLQVRYDENEKPFVYISPEDLFKINGFYFADKAKLIRALLANDKAVRRNKKTTAGYRLDDDYAYRVCSLKTFYSRAQDRIMSQVSLDAIVETMEATKTSSLVDYLKTL